MIAARAISHAAILVGAIGCGRIDFDPLGDARATDAPAPLGAFMTPVPVPGLSVVGADDDDPVVSADGLELYFTSDRAGGVGGSDVYRATRPSPAAAWGAPALVAELSSPNDETQPSLCCGDLVMYLGSSRAGSLGSNDIYRATRTSLAAPWSTPTLVWELATAAYEAGAPDADELEIIFDSDRGGPARELYRATRALPTDPWSSPVLIAELAGGNLKVDAQLVTPRLLIFTSIPLSGPGYFELYTVEREGPGEPFGTPALVEGVNTSEAERDGWLSPDLRTIYFAREDTNGDYAIFTATR